MTKRGDPQSARDYAFIQDVWAVITALAWDGYQERGRGVVVVTWGMAHPSFRMPMRRRSQPRMSRAGPGPGGAPRGV
jgi:hypothetical protein